MLDLWKGRPYLNITNQTRPQLLLELPVFFPLYFWYLLATCILKGLLVISLYFESPGFAGVSYCFLVECVWLSSKDVTVFIRSHCHWKAVRARITSVTAVGCMCQLRWAVNVCSILLFGLIDPLDHTWSLLGSGLLQMLSWPHKLCASGKTEQFSLPVNHWEVKLIQVKHNMVVNLLVAAGAEASCFLRVQDVLSVVLMVST